MSIVSVPERSERCPPHLVESARQLGIATDEDTRFRENWGRYRPLRTLLATLCREEGWEEERVGR